MTMFIYIAGIVWGIVTVAKWLFGGGNPFQDE